MLACATAALAEPVVLDGVAARVNDAAITVGDVMEVVAPLRQQWSRTLEGAELDRRTQEAYSNALNSLIESKLICRAFEADGKVNAEWLNREVDRRVDELIRERFKGDRAAFLDALKDERLTLADWRQRIRESLIVSYMRNKEVDSRISVSPAEIKAAYDAQVARYRRAEQIHLRLIVIHGAEKEADRAARRQRADEVRQKAAGGGDFAMLARQFSEDGKAESGGDWGLLEPSDLRKELGAVAGKLSAGQVSDVIEVEGDYYILKVDERQAAGQVPLDDVRKDIERTLRQKEGKRLHDAWIVRLKKDAYVQIVQSDPWK